MKFQNADFLDVVLPFYAELVNRTVLRPTALPSLQISLVSQTPLTREEAIQALDSVLALNGITVIPQGEKFITVQQSTAANTEGAAFSKKKASELPEAAQYLTQIVQLTNVLPSEVVQIITPFAKNPAGIVPIDANRILVLRDYAINVKRMMEIIEEIDVHVPAEVQMKLIPIKYAPVADISAVLGSLTSGGVASTTGRTTGTTGRTTGRTGSTLGRGTTGTTFGQPGTTGQPGSTQFRQPGTTFTPQQNIPGQQPGASSALSSFQDRMRDIINRAASGGSGLPLGEAKIIPDERTNSLLVFGTAEEIKEVEKIIKELDVVQQQVLIEAIIMEVTLDDTRNIGFSFAQNPKSLGAGNLTFGGSRNVDFGSSITNALPGGLPGGFSYYGLLGNDWEVAMTAIATDGSINVLSRPRIQTSHAKEAYLFIGNTVPFITGTFTDINGGARSQFQNQQVGITLSIFPLINDDGLVVLDIVQNVQQLGTPTTIDGNPVPTTTERNAQANVAVKNGDTIILGGFISSTKSKGTSGVPYLKDIPLLGALFRSRNNSNQRVELIALIRPTVLKTPELAAVHTAEEREKLWGVRRAEQELLDEEKAAHAKEKALLEKRQRAKDAVQP
ncbi:MAG: secretin N-terminal domain-containing protein [Verrucomicrobiota bacterium]